MIFCLCDSIMNSGNCSIDSFPEFFFLPKLVLHSLMEFSQPHLCADWCSYRHCRGIPMQAPGLFLCVKFQAPWYSVPPCGFLKLWSLTLQFYEPAELCWISLCAVVCKWPPGRKLGQSQGSLWVPCLRESVWHYCCQCLKKSSFIYLVQFPSYLWTEGKTHSSWFFMVCVLVSYCCCNKLVIPQS